MEPTFQGLNARERSRVETRHRLLSMGQELFAEKGVADTRAADVAKAAGVAVGTLYLHFGDKRGLLRAILFEGIEELLSSLRALSDHPPADLREALRIHSEIMVRFAEEHRALCRILFDPESVRTQVSTEINAYLVSMQEKRLRESIASGLVRRDLDPVVVAHAFVGMFVQVLDWWTRDPGRADRGVVVETLTRLRIAALHPQS
ncbi:MAG TPA: TetR/AcrR family transcriptional regulator [Candidatus Hydrogenedentes bacterium]|nr:TetR/AcrR family transcriptional regulator [Candidatus Hydrogenedentota bacterium]